MAGERTGTGTNANRKRKLSRVEEEIK